MIEVVLPHTPVKDGNFLHTRKTFEKMAYEELKSNYLSQRIARYKYMVGMTAALKKDPVHQRIMRTAKRLREEEDYDEYGLIQNIKNGAIKNEAISLVSGWRLWPHTKLPKMRP